MKYLKKIRKIRKIRKMKKRLICCFKQQILIKLKYYIYKIKYYTKLNTN
jgi:hypothetical protein